MPDDGGRQVRSLHDAAVFKKYTISQTKNQFFLTIVIFEMLIHHEILTELSKLHLWIGGMDRRGFGVRAEQGARAAVESGWWLEMVCVVQTFC